MKCLLLICFKSWQLTVYVTTEGYFLYSFNALIFGYKYNYMYGILVNLICHVSCEFCYFCVFILVSVMLMALRITLRYLKYLTEQ